MTTSTDPAPSDPELKTRHRTMWALDDYPTLADELIADLGAILVRACDVRAGEARYGLVSRPVGAIMSLGPTGQGRKGWVDALEARHECRSR